MGAYCPSRLLHHMVQKFINKCSQNPTLMLTDHSFETFEDHKKQKGTLVYGNKVENKFK